MNWDNITIGKYLQILEVDGKTDLEETLRALAIIEGKSYEDMRKLGLDELNALITDFAKIGIEDIPHTKKPPKKWREYEITTKLQDITTGQMIDYDSVLESGDIENLHILMAILTNPKDKEELDKRAKLFYNEMPISIAHSCNVFFCKVQEKLGQNTQIFLSKQKKKTKSLTNSQRFTDGWESFICYLRDFCKRGNK